MIGELQEKDLHHYLKNYLESDEKYHEIKVGPFYADIKKDDLIIEVQTQNLDKLKDKLDYYLQEYQVEVVYPISEKKILRSIDSDGKITERKSPKMGSIYDSIKELYKIKTYLKNDNLKISLIMLNTIEERKKTNNSRKGFSKINTYPVEVIRKFCLSKVNDYLVFIDGLPHQFTSSDLRKTKKINGHISSLTLHILNYLGVIKRIGKEKQSYLYERS